MSKFEEKSNIGLVSSQYKMEEDFRAELDADLYLRTWFGMELLRVAALNLESVGFSFPALFPLS